MRNLFHKQAYFTTTRPFQGPSKCWWTCSWHWFITRFFLPVWPDVTMGNVSIRCAQFLSCGLVPWVYLFETNSIETPPDLCVPLGTFHPEDSSKINAKYISKSSRNVLMLENLLWVPPTGWFVIPGTNVGYQCWSWWSDGKLGHRGFTRSNFRHCCATSETAVCIPNRTIQHR
jgi:hypothetical protein